MTARPPQQTQTIQQLQPYLSVRDAAKAIDFYVEVFGMTERYRLPMGDRIGHAELRFAGARLLLADEFPELGIVGPLTRGGTTVSLTIYVDDVDAFCVRALAAGATQEGETRDEFFGDRVAKIVDPFGHRWFVHQRQEDVSEEEIQRRFRRMVGDAG